MICTVLRLQGSVRGGGHLKQRLVAFRSRDFIGSATQGEEGGIEFVHSHADVVDHSGELKHRANAGLAWTFSQQERPVRKRVLGNHVLQHGRRDGSLYRHTADGQPKTLAASHSCRKRRLHVCKLNLPGATSVEYSKSGLTTCVSSWIAEDCCSFDGITDYSLALESIGKEGPSVHEAP